MNNLKSFSENNNWVFLTKKNFQTVLKSSNFIVILLPTWSDKDITLIEAAKDIIFSFKKKVYVLDIDDFITQEDIQLIFPGILSINQSPVIIFYNNGQFEVMAMGEKEISNLNR